MPATSGKTGNGSDANHSTPGAAQSGTVSSSTQIPDSTAGTDADRQTSKPTTDSDTHTKATSTSPAITGINFGGENIKTAGNEGEPVTVAAPAHPAGTVTGTITATDQATGAVTLTTPKHKAGLTDIPVDYTFDGDPQTTVTLAGAFTYYPTTKTLPLTGGTWGLPAVSAGLALSLLLCASALTAYRHRRYSK